MNNPQWNLPEPLFGIFVWVAIILMSISVLTLLGLLLYEYRQKTIW